MKKLFLIALLITGFSVNGYAVDITLDNPENLTPTQWQKLKWDRISIFILAKTLKIKYRFKTAAGVDIPGTSRDWECSGTCFDDTFGFTIRAQDVGTTLGAGLKQLLWNKMKADVLSPGNDGTLP